MTHEIETMAYAHEVPWHGLGNSVNPDVSVEEMAVAAGLNWTIDPFPVYAQTKTGLVKVPNKIAHMRSSDDKFLAVSSEAWRPVQPKDVLGFFRDYVEAGGARLETAGSLRGGQVIWALASLGKGFETSPGDRSNGYILFSSPNKVGTRIRLRTTSVRVVCANTMAMAEASGMVEFSQNHLSDFDFSGAKECVEMAHESLAAAAARAKTLSGIKLSLLESARLLAPFFGSEQLVRDDEALLDSANRSRHFNDVLGAMQSAPGATPGSAWGVLNGVTYWADHMAGRDNSSRMFRSWMGGNAKLKVDVESALMKLA